MNKQAVFFGGIAGQLHGNQVYDSHMKALRSIYSSEGGPSRRGDSEAYSRGATRANHFSRSKHFLSSESKRRLELENKHMAEKVTWARSMATGNKPRESEEGETYRKMQLRNLIYRKKLELEHLNKNNMKISERIYNQKGLISFKKLETEYAKNREHMDRITKYHHDGNQFTMGNCLVQDNGRFRIPGTSYTTTKNLKPMLKYDGEENKSRTSSRAGSRQSARSRGQTPSKALRTGSKASLRSSKQFKETSDVEFFENRKVPDLRSSKTKPKAFRVTKPGGIQGLKSKPNHIEYSTGNLSKHSAQSSTRPKLSQTETKLVGHLKAVRPGVVSQQGSRAEKKLSSIVGPENSHRVKEDSRKHQRLASQGGERSRTSHNSKVHDQEF